MDQNQFKKLEGEEKKAYLNNLRSAVKGIQPIVPAYLPRGYLLSNFEGMVSALEELNSFELDPSNGLPSTIDVLKVDSVKKNIDKELQDLKAKLFCQQDDKCLSLEQKLVERIKSKIYSFDTFVANEMLSEGTPLHELLNTEFVLRDRLYFLKAVGNNSFTTEAGIYNSPSRNTNSIELSGFDPKENKFCGYKISIHFSDKDRKKLFEKHDTTKLKSKYDEILKKNFQSGNLDAMYKEVFGIKYLWLACASRVTLGPYYDKHTGTTLPIPEGIFQNNPEAFILNLSCEVIEPLEDHSQDYRKNKKTEIKKTVFESKFVHKDIASQLKEIYQGNENIKVYHG